MGLFSRKDKSKSSGNSTAPKQQPSLSIAGPRSSLGSGSSSLKSPVHLHGSAFAPSNRMSSGTTASAMAGSPLTSVASSQLPRVDMPPTPDPAVDPAAYLRNLSAVRERCNMVTDLAVRNKLNHFDVDMQKFPDVVSFVSNIIKRDYDAPFTSIPSHGRHQHFCVGGRDRIAQLLSAFPADVDAAEKCRRMLDLFLVSVLLDAGAGSEWSYKSTENGRTYSRSEGLAIASLDMFKSGLFSSNPSNKYQVDKDGLRSLTVEKLAKGMQVQPGNEMTGLEGRAQLLIRLGHALSEKKDYFEENGRPGNMLDYLLRHPSTQTSAGLVVPMPVLWDVVMNGLASVWPASRTSIDGVSLGDAWPCSTMPQPTVGNSPTSPTFSPFPKQSASSTSVAPWESILPFHKLSQWLTYSLMQPLTSIMDLQFAGQEMMTGLAEYRNGGLFVDLGVLTLKKDDMDRGLVNYHEYCKRTGTKGIEVAPMFEPSDDVIVEWRGVTIGFIDLLLAEVNKALRVQLNGGELSLAQLLEAGSWKGGREIAAVSRPNTKGSPILLDSDGTVF